MAKTKTTKVKELGYFDDVKLLASLYPFCPSFRLEDLALSVMCGNPAGLTIYHMRSEWSFFRVIIEYSDIYATSAFSKWLQDKRICVKTDVIRKIAALKKKHIEQIKYTNSHFDIITIPEMDNIHIDTFEYDGLLTENDFEFTPFVDLYHSIHLGKYDGRNDFIECVDTNNELIIECPTSELQIKKESDVTIRYGDVDKENKMRFVNVLCEINIKENKILKSAASTQIFATV